jgi:type II secretory pathway pseudopilin PulG
MKVTTLKTVPAQRRKAGAFTLIEMIGVLAVIAILAALLIPKVFTAISNARVNNAAVSAQTVKTALADHYAKFGSIPVDGSTNPPAQLTVGAGLALQYDQVLLKEGFLDKPFAVKIGDGITDTTHTRVEVNTSNAGNVSPTTAVSGYALSGNGAANPATATNEVASGSTIAQCIITGVTLSDAKDLNDRIDGISLSAPNATSDDVAGRVKYQYVASGTTTVYIYLTHR